LGVEIDLNEVAVFIQVVQAGSFSGAAKKLSMPNSTISYKVSCLEKRLGVTLIQRTTRKLNITPVGHAYYKKCLQGLEEIKAAEIEIASIQGEPQGLLRITCPVEMGSGVLPTLISDYTKKYPKVRVDLLLTERRVDLLSESVDLAIRAGDLKDSSLIAKKIGSVYFALFASPQYLKSHPAPSHPRELLKHNCIQFAPLGNDEWKLTSSKGSLNVPLSGHISVNDLNMVKNLCLQGDGIAFLPTHICKNETQANKLVRVLPEWRSGLNPVHFVYPAQRFVTPKLTAFMAMGTEALKSSFSGEL
jgi:DNA-binding transcriptional LysR family regulator